MRRYQARNGKRAFSRELRAANSFLDRVGREPTYVAVHQCVEASFNVPPSPAETCASRLQQASSFTEPTSNRVPVLPVPEQTGAHTGTTCFQPCYSQTTPRYGHPHCRGINPRLREVRAFPRADEGPMCLTDSSKQRDRVLLAESAKTGSGQESRFTLGGTLPAELKEDDAAHRVVLLKLVA